MHKIEVLDQLMFFSRPMNFLSSEKYDHSKDKLQALQVKAYLAFEYKNPLCMWLKESDKRSITKENKSPLDSSS